jgi:hypothetical protein
MYLFSQLLSDLLMTISVTEMEAIGTTTTRVVYGWKIVMLAKEFSFLQYMYVVELRVFLIFALVFLKLFFIGCLEEKIGNGFHFLM